jgi:hypothetical protein
MFVFADVEGSAAMMQRPGDAHAGLLTDLRRAGLAAHGG